MSLELVVNEKTIKSRQLLLSNYLKNNNNGLLTEFETVYFKHIFEKYYTPDDKEIKFNTKDILNVSIQKDNYGNKCFTIFVNNIWYPTSIKRLSGSNRSEKYNLNRALRNSIEEQIITFRNLNPLNINNICPIKNIKLGFDAEVDHEIPFYILAEEWLKNNKNVKYKYNINNFNYDLQEPYHSLWYNFHLENAKLRWVSKEGNQVAHKFYI